MSAGVENLDWAGAARRAVAALLLFGATASGTLAFLLFLPDSPWRVVPGVTFGLGVLTAGEARWRH